MTSAIWGRAPTTEDSSNYPRLHTHIRMHAGYQFTVEKHPIDIKLAGIIWTSSSSEAAAPPSPPASPPARLPPPLTMPRTPDQPTLTPQFCFAQTALRGASFLSLPTSQNAHAHAQAPS